VQRVMGKKPTDVVKDLAGRDLVALFDMLNCSNHVRASSLVIQRDAKVANRNDGLGEARGRGAEGVRERDREHESRVILRYKSCESYYVTPGML
jgi:hypothetical protein